jgi:hypothetical protein
VRSTPTFVLLGTAAKASKKAQRKGKAAKGAPGTASPRWRQTGLVKKDQLSRVLESNGASRVTS